jgi:hypothetical protein
MAPEQPSPIDALREVAASATPPVGIEYGLGTHTLPIKNSEGSAPMRVNLKSIGAMSGPATAADIIASIYALHPTLSETEWQRFRAVVGQMLGFVNHHAENDDTE